MTKRTHKDMNYPEMSFYMNESKSDVIFVIEGQRIPALKQTLSLKSPVFEAMFSGNFTETNVKEIEIKDTTFDAFKTLIRFIYTEQLLLKDDNDLKYAFDVYQLSDRYEVLRLRQRVVQYLVSKINVKDLISISRVVFDLNIEELIPKVMTFIESNINELIEWNLKDLKELNDSTNDKLLDVLITGNRLKSNDNILRFVVSKKAVFVKKDVLSRNGAKVWRNFLCFQSEIESNSFDSFKTIIRFLYFNQLILKDEEDLQLIRELCKIFFKTFDCELFFDYIYYHLKHRITVENLQIISKIAFDFKIDELMKSVVKFIEENFTEIFAKSDEELCQINRSIDDNILLHILKNHRKAIQKDL